MPPSQAVESRRQSVCCGNFIIACLLLYCTAGSNVVVNQPSGYDHSVISVVKSSPVLCTLTLINMTFPVLVEEFLRWDLLDKTSAIFGLISPVQLYRGLPMNIVVCGGIIGFIESS